MKDDDLEANIVAAGSAYSQGRYEEALALYETAITARPQNAILFANKAAILLRLDRVDDALISADRAIELDPTWAKAHYRRGEALRRKNSLVAAVVALSEGAALDSMNKQIVDALVDAAQELFSTFSLKRLESIGLERDHFTLLTMVGQELASSGHNREASTVLTRALTLHSPSVRLRESALSALASVHFSLGEYQKATLYYEEQLDLRLQLNGPSAEVYENVAKSAELTGNYQLALSHRMNRLKLLEGVGEAEERLKIACLHCSLNQNSAACEQYDIVEQSLKTLDVDQRMRIALSVRIGRGILHSSMGETLQCLGALSDTDPPNEDDAVKIADAIVACHIKEGNIQNAIEYLNALLKKSTENRQQKLFGHTCFLLAREHIRNGRPLSAIRLAKRILRLARTTSDRRLERAGLQLMATIYEEQHDVQSASALLQKYLEVPEVSVVESVSVHLRLASLAERTGGDPMRHLSVALKLADSSSNLDVVASARSSMLRYLSRTRSSSHSQKIIQLLASQQELLKTNISESILLGVSSRSLIFEDLAMCETGERSGIEELHALEQSLTEAQEGSNGRRELFLLEKLGDCLLSLERFDDANGFYQQLLTLAQQIRAVAQIKRAYTKLAILAAGFEKWDRCVELAKRALTLSRFFHDHSSKAYMMVLVGRAERFRGNNEVAQSIFKKAIERCEEQKNHNTMVLAARSMVDVAVSAGQKDTYVLECVRRHLSLVDYERDEEAKLMSMTRLVRLGADLDHLARLRVVTVARNHISNLGEDKQVELLLECFDAYRALGILDKAWRLLMEILDARSIPRTVLKKIEERLSVFPLRRQALLVVKLAEHDLSDSRTLSRLAFFEPKLALQLITEENTLPQMVCYVQLQDWTKALMCAEAVLSGRLSDRPLGGLFGKFTTEEAVLHVLLVAKWQTNRSLQWPDLSSLDDETFCRFFDVAFSGVLLDGVILTPSSRAHLHALILQEEFDLTHEAAGPVEKIICAANVECHEMISMWYHELVENFLNDSNEGVELFPFSSTEFELKVGTVFTALQHQAFNEQLQVLEMSKWLMDKRLCAQHGRSLEPLPPLPFTHHPITYVYSVGRVQLLWSTVQDGVVSVSLKLLSVDLSFLEECLVRYLRRRGIPETTTRDFHRPDEVFVNDHLDVAAAFTKVYGVCNLSHSVDRGRRYSTKVLNLCNAVDTWRRGKAYSLLSEGISRLSDSFIAVLDSADHLLNADVCFSVEKTPLVVVTRGALPFHTIRALFLCGTVIVVELPRTTEDKELDQLIANICSSSDPIEILAQYPSYIRSTGDFPCWNTSPDCFDCKLWNISPVQIDEEPAGPHPSSTNVCKAMAALLLETDHIGNLWLKATQSKPGNSAKECQPAGNDANPLNELCKELLGYKSDDTLLSNSESPVKTPKSEAARSRRRTKKLGNYAAHGYLSDGAEMNRSDSAGHIRSHSDALSRSTTSTICSDADAK